MGNYFSIDEEFFSYGVLSYGYYPNHPSCIQSVIRKNKINIEMSNIQSKTT